MAAEPMSRRTFRTLAVPAGVAQIVGGMAVTVTGDLRWLVLFFAGAILGIYAVAAMLRGLS